MSSRLTTSTAHLSLNSQLTNLRPETQDIIDGYGNNMGQPLYKFCLCPLSVDTKEQDGEGGKALGVSVYHLKTTFQNEVKNFMTEKRNAGEGDLGGGKDQRGGEGKMYHELNIYNIVEGVIKAKGANIRCPRDGQIGTSYVDCLEGDDHVGTATLMLSYAWANSVADIIDVLERFCGKFGLDVKRTYVWICCLCNNQHRFDGEKEFGELEATFKAQVIGIGEVVALMSPHYDPFYCSRAWCVFEFHTANESKTKLHIMLPRREEEKMVEEALLGEGGSEKLFESLRVIKIEEAEASMEQDKVNIMTLVKLNGGAVQLNHAVNDRLRQWQIGVIEDACARMQSNSNDPGTDLNLAKSFLNAGEIYMDRGYFDLALETCFTCMYIYERVHGKSHADTAVAYHNIAEVYWKQGEYTEALNYHRKALKIFEEIYGDENADIARTYNDMAGVYYNQGDYVEALAFFNKALAIRMNVLGSDHQDTATTFNDMAMVYEKEGKYTESLHYYRKALTIKEKAIGMDHQETASTLNNVALVYRKQGQYDSAIENYNKARAIFEKILGMDHQDTASCYHNIAVVYRKQGKYDEAIEYYAKALSIRENVLGHDHQSTAVANYNMADSYECQGDFKNALRYYEKCVRTREKVLGSKHSKTRRVKSKVIKMKRKLKEEITS